MFFQKFMENFLHFLVMMLTATPTITWRRQRVLTGKMTWQLTAGDVAVDVVVEWTMTYGKWRDHMATSDCATW